MELANEFEVPLSIDEAWRVLTDLERVAPCMPGAQLQEVEGSDYRGLVRVKVGPISVDYKGTASFTELDAAAHRAVLKATGRETRGQGNATATVHATLEAREGTTHVAITTDLEITGRVAQFGRGALADVSTRLLGQFADNLAKDLNSAGEAAPAGESSAPAADGHEDADASTASSASEDGTAVASPEADGETSGIRHIDAPPPAPLQLRSLIGAPLLKRVAPLVAVVAALAIVLRRRLQRRH